MLCKPSRNCDLIYLKQCLITSANNKQADAVTKRSSPGTQTSAARSLGEAWSRLAMPETVKLPTYYQWLGPYPENLRKTRFYNFCIVVSKHAKSRPILKMLSKSVHMLLTVKFLPLQSPLSVGTISLCICSYDIDVGFRLSAVKPHSNHVAWIETTTLLYLSFPIWR